MTEPTAPGTTEPEPTRAEVAPPEDEFEDDQPDYVRLAILSAFLVMMICALIYTRFINPPKKPFYAEIPGVDLTALSQAQRDEVLRIANDSPCGCGDPDCHYNVAECRHAMNTTCEASLKKAAEIVQRVTGQPAKFTVPVSFAPGAGSMAPPASPVPGRMMAPPASPVPGRMMAPPASPVPGKGQASPGAASPSSEQPSPARQAPVPGKTPTP